MPVLANRLAVPMPSGDALAGREAGLGRCLEWAGARAQEVPTHRQPPRLQAHALLVDAESCACKACAPPLRRDLRHRQATSLSIPVGQ